MRYGSDLVIEFLQAAGIEYVALNPGASFRGLHDSLVHVDTPKPIVVLHEETGIGIAHGYAKSAGFPMAVFVHNLVGLQHATMAIFNAWADNVPMLIIGGSGPRDASKRRPWIDWVHSAQLQGATVHDIVKWHDEPASLDAIPHSLARAWRIAQTPPMGPVYVSIDAGLQETELTDDDIVPVVLDAPHPVVAPSDIIRDVASALADSNKPVIVVDRPGPGALNPLVEMADLVAPSVIDLGSRCSFPSTHWADQTSNKQSALAEADFVLALEARDLAWSLTKLNLSTRQTELMIGPDVPVISVGLTETQHTGFMTREALLPGTKYVISDVTSFLKELVECLTSHSIGAEAVAARREILSENHRRSRESAHQKAVQARDEKPITEEHLALSLWEAIGQDNFQLAYGVLKDLPRFLWDLTDESSYLGRSGGEGLGYGVPASLGAALAHRDSDTLVVDIQSDGDLMYTASALWTAAHHQLPLLIVVHNNRSYGRDERHQRVVAEARGRSLENLPIGIHIDNPPVDFATLAESMGVKGFGPIEEPDAVPETIREAKKIVQTERRAVLVDVICRR